MEQSHSWQAKIFSTIQELLLHFMEPEVSLPHLQKPNTCSYSEPDQSSICPPSQFLNTHLKIISPTLHGSSGSSKWSLSPRFPQQNPACTSFLHCTCYMPCPFHPSWFHQSNNSWCRIQTVTVHNAHTVFLWELLIVQTDC